MLKCAVDVINAAHFLLKEDLMMECVAYMRVSTEKQAIEGNGLDSQKRDIENYEDKMN